MITTLLLFLGPFAHAGPNDAEALRLSDEIVRLAQKTAWTGVERKYGELESLKKVEVSGHVHLLGAQAARQRGDVAAAYVRAQRALQVDPSDQEVVDEASRWLADFLVNYGQVEIQLSVGFKGEPTVQALDGAGFNPKIRQSMAVVETHLVRDRHYAGFLPLGRYRIGQTDFDIYGGPKVEVFVKPVKGAPPVDQPAPEPLPAERPPDRIVTLAVRGGGWSADTWDAVSPALRDALYDVDGVLTVDLFQPSDPWVLIEPDAKRLEAFGLDLVTMASKLQAATDNHRLVTTDDALAYPPGTVEALSISKAVLTTQNDAGPLDVHLEDLATIRAVRTGPFPVPRDTSELALHRIEVKVRGDSDAATALLSTLTAVEGAEALGLKLEEQVVR